MRYEITPCPKPRQTQSDRWKKRPAVLRYRAFKDEVKLKKLTIPNYGFHVTFILPMPNSWPRKKQEAMIDMPHSQKPDVDNLLKALFDAVHEEDCSIWDCRVTKLWGNSGAIIINNYSRNNKNANNKNRKRKVAPIHP